MYCVPSHLVAVHWTPICHSFVQEGPKVDIVALPVPNWGEQITSLNPVVAFLLLHSAVCMWLIAYEYLSNGNTAHLKSLNGCHITIQILSDLRSNDVHKNNIKAKSPSNLHKPYSILRNNILKATPLIKKKKKQPKPTFTGTFWRNVCPFIKIFYKERSTIPLWNIFHYYLSLNFFQYYNLSSLFFVLSTTGVSFSKFNQWTITSWIDQSSIHTTST